MLRGDPLAFDHADGMIAPESSFFGIDSDDRKRKIFLGVGLNDHAFVQDRRREILRPVGEHFAFEKTRGAAVVNDAVLDACEKLFELRLVQVSESKAGGFARRRVSLGEERNQTAIAVFGMRVTKLEFAPL